MKVAFGVYQIKAWKKNRQGKANVRKRKANGKTEIKSKTDRVGGSSDPNYVDNDTTGYGKGSVSNCTTIKMVFFKPAKRRKDQTDTVTVGFSQPGEDIKELDLVQIDGYLYKHDKHDIIKVKLCDCDKDAKNNEVLRSIYLQRSSKITHYLKEKKIPKKKIELE